MYGNDLNTDTCTTKEPLIYDIQREYYVFIAYVTNRKPLLLNKKDGTEDDIHKINLFLSTQKKYIYVYSLKNII